MGTAQGGRAVGAAGVDGCARTWTAERIAAQLVEEFRALPGCGIYSPRGDACDLRIECGPNRDLTLIRRSAVLGLRSPTRHAVLEAARARAAGQSIRELLRLTGRNRDTFYRRRRQGLAQLAAALNGEAAPYIKSTACLSDH